MSTPVLGRNARLYKDGVAIGYGKNISLKASAELIKEYSMDSLEPCIVAPGKQTFNWSADKLYVDETFLYMLLEGTEFDMVFQPQGSYLDEPYEEWSGCVVLNVERTAGETGGLLEKVSGEATSVNVED